MLLNAQVPSTVCDELWLAVLWIMLPSAEPACEAAPAKPFTIAKAKNGIDIDNQPAVTAMSDICSASSSILDNVY